MATGVAAFGIVLAAAYILWMVQRSFFGPMLPRFADVKDATAVDLIPVVGLIIPIVAIGIWPSLVTDSFRVGIEAMLG